MTAILASRKNQPSLEGEHIGVFTKLCRHWLPFISSRDLHLVLTVLDLTLGRKWKSAHYHVSDLTDGTAWGDSDRARHHGSTLSRSSIFRAKKSLTANGLVSFKQGWHAGYIIQLNDEWEPEGFEEEAKRRIAFFRRRRRKAHEKVTYLWQPAHPSRHIGSARLLCNDWLRFLSAPELKIMLMIADCSFGHRKTECHLTVDQLRLGVFDKKGEGVWSMGTGLSPRAIYVALASLEERGAIYRRKGIGSGYILAINPDRWGEAVEAREALEHLPAEGHAVAEFAQEDTTEERDDAPEPAENPVLSAATLTPDKCIPDTHPTIDSFSIDRQVLTTFVPAGGAPLASLKETPGKNAYASPHGLTFPAKEPYSPSPLAPVDAISSSDDIGSVGHEGDDRGDARIRSKDHPAAAAASPKAGRTAVGRASLAHAALEEASATNGSTRMPTAEAGKAGLRIPDPGPADWNVIYLPAVSRLLRHPNAPLRSRANASSDMEERRRVFELTGVHLLWPERQPITPARLPGVPP